MGRSENLSVFKRQEFEAIGKNLSLQKTDNSAPTQDNYCPQSRKLTKGKMII